MKINIIVSCLTLLFMLSSFHTLHAIKTSVSEIILHKNSMRIRIKFFPDDLPALLPLHVKGNEIDSVNMEYLHAYIKSNFSIAINNAPILYTFQRFYTDQEATSKQTKTICIVYECAYKNAGAIKTFELRNTLLFDRISEQKNISKITFEDKNTKTLTFKNHDIITKKSIYIS